MMKEESDGVGGYDEDGVDGGGGGEHVDDDEIGRAHV